MNTSSINISNADLVRVAATGIICARRDRDIMLTFGIDDAYIAAVEADKNLLMNMPTDKEVQEAVSELTNDKNLKREIVHNAISSIMVRAKIVFGAKSTVVRGFYANDLSKLTDSDLIRTANSVKRMSLSKLEALLPKGLTPAMIETFGTQIVDFDKSLDTLKEAEMAHLEDTEKRHALSRKLYNQIAEISDYGKTYWRGRNALKYADYVIFDAPTSHKSSKPTGRLHGTVTHAATGAALAHALLVLAGTTLSASTDANGHYLFEQAPPSTYTLSCFLAGMKPLEKANIAVTAGNDTACDFALSQE